MREAERSPDPQFAGWRPGRADGIRSSSPRAHRQGTHPRRAAPRSWKAGWDRCLRSRSGGSGSFLLSLFVVIRPSGDWVSPPSSSGRASACAVCQPVFISPSNALPATARTTLHRMSGHPRTRQADTEGPSPSSSGGQTWRTASSPGCGDGRVPGCGAGSTGRLEVTPTGRGRRGQIREGPGPGDTGGPTVRMRQSCLVPASV